MQRPRIQRVYNEHWPFRDSKGRGHAEGVATQRDWIAIRARLVFARDGEQWLYGWAVAWTKDAVCVQLEDRRLPTSRIWLAPSDVQRRVRPTDRQSR